MLDLRVLGLCALALCACGARSGLDVAAAAPLDAGRPRDAGRDATDAPIFDVFPCRWTTRVPIEVARVRGRADRIDLAIDRTLDRALAYARAPSGEAQLVSIELGFVDATVDAREDMPADVERIVGVGDAWAIARAPRGPELCALEVRDARLTVVEPPREVGCAIAASAGRIFSARPLPTGGYALEELSPRGGAVHRATVLRAPAAPELSYDPVSEEALGLAGDVLVAWRLDPDPPRVAPFGARALSRLVPDFTLGGAAMIIDEDGPLVVRIRGEDAPPRIERVTAFREVAGALDPAIATNETEVVASLLDGRVFAAPLNGARIRRVDAPPVDAHLARVALRAGSTTGGQLYAEHDPRRDETTISFRTLVCNR